MVSVLRLQVAVLTYGVHRGRLAPPQRAGAHCAHGAFPVPSQGMPQAPGPVWTHHRAGAAHSVIQTVRFFDSRANQAAPSSPGLAPRPSPAPPATPGTRQRGLGDTLAVLGGVHVDRRASGLRHGVLQRVEGFEVAGVAAAFTVAS